MGETEMKMKLEMRSRVIPRPCESPGDFALGPKALKTLQTATLHICPTSSPKVPLQVLIAKS